jgi:hypothetical protein
MIAAGSGHEPVVATLLANKAEQYGDKVSYCDDMYDAQRI